MQNEPESSPAEGKPNVPIEETIEQLKEKLGLGTERDRLLDDEMQRPPDDRSPLT